MLTSIPLESLAQHTTKEKHPKRPSRKARSRAKTARDSNEATEAERGIDSTRWPVPFLPRFRAKTHANGRLLPPRDVPGEIADGEPPIIDAGSCDHAVCNPIPDIDSRRCDDTPVAHKYLTRSRRERAMAAPRGPNHQDWAPPLAGEQSTVTIQPTWDGHPWSVRTLPDATPGGWGALIPVGPDGRGAGYG